MRAVRNGRNAVRLVRESRPSISSSLTRTPVAGEPRGSTCVTSAFLAPTCTNQPRGALGARHFGNARPATREQSNRRLCGKWRIEPNRELKSAAVLAGDQQQRIQPVRRRPTMVRQSHSKARYPTNHIVDLDPFGRFDAIASRFACAHSAPRRTVRDSSAHASRLAKYDFHMLPSGTCCGSSSTSTITGSIPRATRTRCVKLASSPPFASSRRPMDVISPTNSSLRSDLRAAGNHLRIDDGVIVLVVKHETLRNARAAIAMHPYRLDAAGLFVDRQFEPLVAKRELLGQRHGRHDHGGNEHAVAAAQNIWNERRDGRSFVVR